MKNSKRETELGARLAHELRTPLQVIKGYSEYLHTELSADVRAGEIFPRIMRNIAHIESTIDACLLLAKVEAGGDLPKEKILAKKIIDEALEILTPKITEKKIEIKFLDTADELEINVHSGLALQALINVLDNSIKFSPAASRITIEIYAKKKFISLRISDQGYGIANKDRKHIFKKFYTGRAKKILPAVGHGLGLVLVRTIVKQHGGKVLVASKEGKGSEFELCFPR